MDDSVPFASREYFIMLAILVFSRGMDFLSTWVATPHLVLEGNPVGGVEGGGAEPALSRARHHRKTGPHQGGNRATW